MAQGKTPEKTVKKGATREDRLKAALKANMARRKAQARARAQDDTPQEAPSGSMKDDT